MALLTHDLATSLLRSRVPLEGTVFSTAEDDLRPWSKKLAQMDHAGKPIRPMPNPLTRTLVDKLCEKPLLRIFDPNSGSQPDAKNRMKARSPRHPLCDKKERKDTLTFHIDNRNWDVPTPYISFFDSPAGVTRLAEMRRKRRRGPQSLVAIDPMYRFVHGLPILDYEEEARFYDVASSYSEDYFKDHYLCLWEVTPKEIVGIWQWDNLRLDPEWYANVILPAFRNRPTSLSSLSETDQLVQAMGTLAVDDVSSSPVAKTPVDLSVGQSSGGLCEPDSDITDSDDAGGHDHYWSGSDDSYEEVILNNTT